MTRQDDRASPARSVVDAFGGQWPPQPLSGGEGRSWRAGDIVLKPLDLSIDELEWQADVLGRIRADAFRVSPPLRASDGAVSFDGWYASPFLVGQHEISRWTDIIRAGEAFHVAIAVEPRPPFLDARTDPWAIGDRVAWGELPVSDFTGAKHVTRLASARRPISAPSQVVHGDLTGNVLFAEELAPAIIDLSPYWRPAPFAVAIVVADALVREGADVSLVAQVGHIKHFDQYLVRSLIYRAVTDHIARPARARRRREDRYLAAVEIALGLCARAGAPAASAHF